MLVHFIVLLLLRRVFADDETSYIYFRFFHFATVFNLFVQLHVFSWAVAGIFVCLALPITLHDVHMHCIHYVSPLQKYVVRIILIVPIYAIESWFALRYKDQKIYLETLREVRRTLCRRKLSLVDGTCVCVCV